MIPKSYLCYGHTQLSGTSVFTTLYQKLRMVSERLLVDARLAFSLRTRDLPMFKMFSRERATFRLYDVESSFIKQTNKQTNKTNRDLETFL